MKIWLVVKYYLMNISFIKIRASIEEIWPKYVAQAFLPPPESSAQNRVKLKFSWHSLFLQFVKKKNYETYYQSARVQVLKICEVFKVS